MVWTTLDGDDILFALPKTLRKTANRHRDPRAAVVVFDVANPYESVQVQGAGSIEDDPDGTLVEELSQQYTGGPYPGFAGPNPHWVIARIIAERSPPAGRSDDRSVRRAPSVASCVDTA